MNRLFLRVLGAIFPEISQSRPKAGLTDHPSRPAFELFQSLADLLVDITVFHCHLNTYAIRSPIKIYYEIYFHSNSPQLFPALTLTLIGTSSS